MSTLKPKNNRLFIASKLPLLLLLISITGCTGTPVAIYYYQLDDARDQQISEINLEKRQVVALQRLEVPGYLKQTSLVMKQQDQRLHFSASHIWAETPDQAIYHALLEDLNNLSEEYYFIAWHNQHKTRQKHSARIVIRHFYPTESGDVVLAGSIELTDMQDDTVTVREFYLETALQKDGYAHAIKIMREQVTALAKEVLFFT